MTFNIENIPNPPFIHQVQDFLPGATFLALEDNKHYILALNNPGGGDCEVTELIPSDPQLGVSTHKIVPNTWPCILTEISATITFPAQ